MKEDTCCVTGHRPQSLPWGHREHDPRCVALKKLMWKEMRRLIEERGVRHFISGMAMGADTYAAELVLMLRDTYPGITLECAIPCVEQTKLWPEEDRERYLSLLEQADRETLVQREISEGCYRKRNRYMVDNSAFVLAVWNGRGRSGTQSTVDYAKKQGREIIVINPWKSTGPA